jgi:hypothetical protein
MGMIDEGVGFPAARQARERQKDIRHAHNKEKAPREAGLFRQRLQLSAS